MPIAIDATSPARATANATAVTSASFTPPAGSILVATVQGSGSAAANPTVAITNTGTVGAWTLVGRATDTTTGSGVMGGVATIHWALITTSAAVTVTATQTSGTADTSLRIYVVTGAVASAPFAASPIVGFSSVDPANPTIATTVSGSRIAVSASEWVNAGAPTSSTFTDEDAFSAVNIAGFSATLAMPTSGTVQPVNMDASGASGKWHYVLAEILPSDAPIPVGTPTSASTTAASVAVTAPAGLAVGDHQLIIAAMTGLNAATTPAGWALLAMVENNSDTGPFRTYFFTSSADTASVTVSKAGAVAMHLVRLAWRGGQGFNANTLAMEPIPPGTAQLQNTSFALPSCTTTLRESMVVAVAHVDSGSAATTFTNSAGWTERYDASVLTGRSVAVYDIVVVTPGAQTGTLTLSRSDFINMIAVELTATAVTRVANHRDHVARDRAALW